MMNNFKLFDLLVELEVRLKESTNVHGKLTKAVGVNAKITCFCQMLHHFGSEKSPASSCVHVT